MSFGITARLASILAPGRPSLVAVIDDGFFSGPSGRLQNVQKYAESLMSLEVDAIMGFPGTLEASIVPDSAPPLIVNLSVSGFFPNTDERSTPISTLRAIRLAATAVTVHASVGVHNDVNMLASLARTIEDAHHYALPVIAAIYYRQPSPSPDLITHAARIALELGADAVKTAYTGSVTSFEYLVEACAPLPVFVAGGPHESDERLIQVAHEAVRGGAAGFCFGRSLANCADLAAMVRTLRDIGS